MADWFGNMPNGRWKHFDICCVAKVAFCEVESGAYRRRVVKKHVETSIQGPIAPGKESCHHLALVSALWAYISIAGPSLLMLDLHAITDTHDLYLAVNRRKKNEVETTTVVKGKEDLYREKVLRGNRMTESRRRGRRTDRSRKKKKKKRKRKRKRKRNKEWNKE